ncbi:stalk domain-containing protein [Paenibacillus sp. TH7-28]
MLHQIYGIHGNVGITPIVEKRNTLVPLRFLADQLGAKLSLNAKTGDITLGFAIRQGILYFVEKFVILYRLNLINGGSFR